MHSHMHTHTRIRHAFPAQLYASESQEPYIHEERWTSGTLRCCPRVPGRCDEHPPSQAQLLEGHEATIPVSTPLLTLLHALEEAAGEEGHGHEQDDGTAHNGGDHCHLEAKGLVGWHSCKGKTTAPGTADPDLLGPGC